LNPESGFLGAHTSATSAVKQGLEVVRLHNALLTVVFAGATQLGARDGEGDELGVIGVAGREHREQGQFGFLQEGIAESAVLEERGEVACHRNSAFKDVDFEGSNINTLVDLLSYNTYLNSFYTNMVASEMFIDTAQLRDSVISHAKSLNYTPRSFVSASAEIGLTVTPSSPTTNIVIPKGTTFTSRVGSNTYTFSTSSNEVINTSNNGVFTANIMLYEGTYIADSFTMNYSNTSQRFVLSNPTIDTGSVSVTVIEDGGSTTLAYTKTLSLNLTSYCWFSAASTK